MGLVRPAQVAQGPTRVPFQPKFWPGAVTRFSSSAVPGPTSHPRRPRAAAAIAGASAPAAAARLTGRLARRAGPRLFAGAASTCRGDRRQEHQVSENDCVTRGHTKPSGKTGDK